MLTYRYRELAVALEKKGEVRHALARELRLNPEEIFNLVVERFALDSRRKGAPHWSYNVIFDVARPLHASGNAARGLIEATRERETIESDPLAGSVPMASHVDVIGAGPAGLTSAIELARRGFSVTVFEKGEKPGGQVITAAAGHLKGKLSWCIEDMMTQAKKLGIEFRFGTEADKDTVSAFKPDGIVIAAGSKPVIPRSIKGIDRENVCTAPDILLGKIKLNNKKAAVIGSGLTGLETAENLSLDGNDVTIIEAAPSVAPKAWFQHVDDALSRLNPLGVKILTLTSLESIGDGEITIRTESGNSETLPCDNVVLAVGVRPDKSLLDDMQNITVNTIIVGDANHGGNIGKANHDAYSELGRIR